MAQKDFDTEDTVICLDISRSMARKDFKPNRLDAVKEALITFIRQKLDIDKTDRFALVTFSTNAKIVQELTNDPKKIVNVLKNITPQGISSLGEGLAVALHVVSDQILKQGNNINRIIVISDGKPWLGTVDPLEKARIMGEVGVIVDTVELTSQRASWGHNILESISILGEYYQVSDLNYLNLTMRTLSHKKDVYELKKTTPKLHLIAEYLLNPKDLTEELADAIKQVSKEEKCVICRTLNCNICGTNDCGRLCPYCKTFLHLCCAKKWSEESKMVEANVFRCPHCLFLLRLPEEISIPKALETDTASEEPKEADVKLPLVEGKVGDFIIEHGQVKLITKLFDQDKTLYISWDRWGSRDFNCNIMSGMNEIICKEFTPKINWVERTCSGFILCDHLGWFSRPTLEHGVFLLDLIQFENWCKVLISDIEQIKGILQKHPEIKIQSDKLIDFEFSVDVNYRLPIDTTDRNKLDQRLLEDAGRYLKLLRNRPYFKISMDKILEIPKIPIETSIVLEPSQLTEVIIQQSFIAPSKPILIPSSTPPEMESTSISIENPYTGQSVEIPKVSSEEKDIGIARTLAVPKSPKLGKKAQKLQKMEISIPSAPESSKYDVSPIQKPPEKIKLHCNSCQKWFEVEKFDQFPCPTCNQPLKLAIRCKACKNWFSVSKPGKYNCPKCEAVIDASDY
ncbi:MAG: VWA domain-containing protein [Promethearchaeota archaeon]